MNLEQLWWQQTPAPAVRWLLPLSWLYRTLDRLNAKLTVATGKQVSVPVVVVGNIVVGGTGKSLMISYLAEQLLARGWRVGVVSRGYGSAAKHLRVLPLNACAKEYGDEPVMLKQRLPQAVIAVGRRRADAARLIADQVDVILSDDGLQHYALWRDVEIVMLDGTRQLGNGELLPAGPLRELPSRLTSVDFVVTKGTALQLSPDAQLDITGLEFIPLSSGKNPATPAAAVTGIGNPESFFDALSAAGISASTHAFPDHHNFTEQDVASIHAQTIYCTAKDAVKLAALVPNKLVVCQPQLRLSNDKIIEHIEDLCRST